MYPRVVLSQGGSSVVQISLATALMAPYIGYALGLQGIRTSVVVIRLKAHQKRGPPFFSIIS
jgi:hypothetical protein